MTVAARKKYTKPMLGRIMVHFDCMTACVTFHLGAMMMGAQRTDIATLANWKGAVKTSGEMSGNAMLGNAAVACLDFVGALRLVRLRWVRGQASRPKNGWRKLVKP